MSFDEIESRLGYKIDTINYPNEGVKRFYSSLRLVPDSIYQRAVEEFDTYTSNVLGAPVSPFFSKLPRELRDRIYDFASPRQQWELDEAVSMVTELDLLGSIEPGILTVNHQLLLGIGRIGRENIESLEFRWQSKAEFEFTRDEAPGIVRREDIVLSKVALDGMELEDPFFTLPVVHVETCLQLLKQCNRLTDIRLILEKELIDVMNPDAFKAHVGIRGLSSIRGLKRVEIWSFDQEPLEQEGVARWLKEQMESPVL
ncbi:MAG: hypothetical protein Q9209_001546 [Squamulea sp. 1 TL-2023]